MSVAPVGMDQTGTTQTFRIYPFEDWNIEVVDSPGLRSLEPNFTSEEVIDLIDGKRECKSYQSGLGGLERIFSERRKPVHCVIYVCNSEDIIPALTEIRKEIHRRGLLFFVVLTKIETLPGLEIKKLFQNTEMKEKVELIARKTNTGEANVFPVWMKVAECHEPERDLLVLKTIKAILERTEENLRSEEATVNAAANIRSSHEIEWFHTGILWNSEGLSRLYEAIHHYRPPAGIERTRILFIGNSQMGKSSFINSVFSAKYGVLQFPAPAGKSNEPVTLDYSPYPATQYINLIDSPGFPARSYTFDKDLEAFILGKFCVKRTKHGTLERTPIKPEEGELHERVHCVVFVITAEFSERDMKEHIADIKFQEYSKFLRKRGMQALILLTMVDKFADDVPISDIFKSKKVQSKMDEVYKASGCTNNCILPMVNLCGTGMPTTDHSFLALYNMKRILMCADVYINTILQSSDEVKDK